jgi:hypothetical protein
MINDYLKNALPFYSSLALQNRHLKPSANVHALIAPQDTLLPFQLMVDDVEGAEVDDVRVMDLDDTTVIWDSTTPDFAHIHLDKMAGGKNYIWYYSGIVINTLPPGKYYLMVRYNGVDHYSEVFEVRCFNAAGPHNYVRLEWDNDGCDLPPILYQTGFKNVMYLETVIAQEAPTIEQEGSSDGLNNFTPTFQKYVDNLSLDDALPFFQADALVLMAMHKRVSITTHGQRYTGTIRNIVPNMSQVDGGHLYQITLRFQQDTVYKNDACCKNMQLATSVCTLTLTVESIGLVESHPGQGYSYEVILANSDTPLSAKLEYSLNDGASWQEPSNVSFGSNFDDAVYSIELGQLTDLPHKLRITTYCQPGNVAPGTPAVGIYNP